MSTSETLNGTDRIMHILHTLVVSPAGMGVRELSRQIGASSSTANRVLLDLCATDLAQVSRDGLYRPGPRLRLVLSCLKGTHPIFKAFDRARDLLDDIPEAAMVGSLYIPNAEEGAVVYYRAPQGPVAYRLEEGSSVPLHAGAIGRSMLGILPVDLLDSLTVEAITQETETDVAEIRRLIAEDQRLGYTVSIGQSIPHAAGVAAAFGSQGMTGSLSLTIPRYSTDSARLHALGSRVAQAVGEVRRTLETVDTAPSQRLRTVATSTAVGRIRALIDALVTVTPAPVDEAQITAALSTTRRTASRLISTASQFGLVSTVNGRITVGPRLLQWAATVPSVIDEPGIVSSIGHRLASETGESVGFVMYDPGTVSAVMARVSPGAHPLSYDIAVGVPVPLHAGAAGKVILAYLPPEVRTRVEIEQFTENTPNEPELLDGQLDEIATQGWARAEGEWIPQAVGISAPIFRNGAVCGAFTITSSRSRVFDLDEKSLVEAVVTAAGEASKLLSLPIGGDQDTPGA